MGCQTVKSSHWWRLLLRCQQLYYRCLPKYDRSGSRNWLDTNEIFLHGHLLYPFRTPHTKFGMPRPCSLGGTGDLPKSLFYKKVIFALFGVSNKSANETWMGGFVAEIQPFCPFFLGAFWLKLLQVWELVVTMTTSVVSLPPKKIDEFASLLSKAGWLYQHIHRWICWQDWWVHSPSFHWAQCPPPSCYTWEILGSASCCMSL